MFKQVHHIGFAVNNLKKVVDMMFDVYKIEPESRTEISERQMEAVLFKVGETYIEYLAPLSNESPLAAHLCENGEGFHHIAYLVEDIEAAIKTLPIDAILKKRKSSVGDWKIADIDSKYSFGLISQIIQK